MDRPFLIGFDSEDGGQGDPFLWCFTHDEGSYWTRRQSEARAYLAKLADANLKPKCKPQAWATNLEYDLCNLFDDDAMLDVRFRFGRQALVSASWKNLEFRDTLRHLPLSVKDLGELVGIQKRHAEMFTNGNRQRRPRDAKTFRQFLSRCQSDATITYRTADLLYQLYGKLGQHPRATLASTALAIWRDGYWGRELHRPKDAIWNAALEAYHGGRTEAFAVGTFNAVRAIDASSMFPWAMTTAPLPLPWGAVRRVGAGAPIEPLGLYRARLTAMDCQYAPVLPVRTSQGTVYPTGTWEAWHVGEELLFARDCGTLVNVREGYTFAETCRPFDGYVAAMFDKKNASRGAGRTLYKLLLNSLYGKFGQRGEKVNCVRAEKLLTMPKPPANWRAWRGFAIFTTEGSPPPWGNNLWPAFITARARIRLAQEIAKLQGLEHGARVLYCDTDSVLFQGAEGLSYPEKAKAPGEFEARGNFARAVIVGKKEYALQRSDGTWEVHVKGVPEAERMTYLRDGKATFERPTRIRSSAVTGRIPNSWHPTTKQRRTHLSERARADGSLPTPKIGEVSIRTKQGR
jgi:hypothetical protein